MSPLPPGTTGLEIDQGRSAPDLTLNDAHSENEKVESEQRATHF